MKNGVYFGEYWNELFVISDNKIEDNFGRPISDIPYNHQLVYIGDFWDESSELERYKKALDEATQALIFYKETRDEKDYPFGVLSNFKSKDRAELALDKIDRILKGEV